MIASTGLHMLAQPSVHLCGLMGWDEPSQPPRLRRPLRSSWTCRQAGKDEKLPIFETARCKGPSNIYVIIFAVFIKVRVYHDNC